MTTISNSIESVDTKTRSARKRVHPSNSSDSTMRDSSLRSKVNFSDYVISSEQKLAGKKLIKWYKDCSEMRSLESQMRSQLLKKTVAKKPPLFSVSRAIAKKDQEQLEKEIGSILTYYTSTDGEKLLQANALATDNRSRWIEISQSVTIGSHIPIVVRDRHENIQAVALIHLTKQGRCYLDELATAPLNLGANGKYRGAGTAAFEDAVFLCARRGCPTLQLNTLRSAANFYKKLGMCIDEYSHGSLSSKEFGKFFNEHGGKAFPK